MTFTLEEQEEIHSYEDSNQGLLGANIRAGSLLRINEGFASDL